MSVDLDELFTALRTDSAGLRLATPATLRAAGDRRKRIRRIGGASAVVVAVAAGTAGSAVGAGGGTPGPGADRVSVVISSNVAPRRTEPPNVPIPEPSRTIISTTRAPTASPSRSPSSSNTASAACGRAGLKAYASTSDPWNMLITISNQSTTPCDVHGFPSLMYTQASGSIAALPTARRGMSNPTVTLPRNGSATVNITVDSGRPDTHVTDCSKPVTYRDIFLALDGGELVSLSAFTIDAQCDAVSITSWSRAAT